MKVNEKPFVFENKQQKLYGILHEPEGGRKNAAVIFLHGWGTYRIGPHRLFVEAARTFASAGFPCLRFDFRGRGESGGNVNDTTLLDMIDDARKSTREMLRLEGVTQIIVLGLCSGGEVAVGTAASEPNVGGAIFLSTPLLGRQALVGDDLKKTARYARGYWKKLFIAETWRKLFGFRVNYGAVLSVLFGHYHHKPANEPMKEAELLDGFRSYRGPCLFIYGGRDPDAPSSEKAYREACAGNENATFRILQDANHNFYSAAWKKDLIAQVSEWLESNFGEKK